MTPTNTLSLEYGPRATIRLAGGDWQQPAGPHGRGGVLPAFARALIAAGHDPATPISVTRDGTPVWARPGTLAFWAGRMASEPSDGSVRMRAYDPAAAADRLRALRSRKAPAGLVAA
ncbi:hypothetical protein EOM89_13550 [Candidatus Falkowbacteria bacterium]|nr:hypothetical protein [Candidatus Falkowbacteria bacterium]